MGDQYIITSTAPEVTGVTGIMGKPVYETGIDGIGFQFSDILSSKNGSINRQLQNLQSYQLTIRMMIINL